jgi:hypothetical protein
MFGPSKKRKHISLVSANIQTPCDHYSYTVPLAANNPCPLRRTSSTHGLISTRVRHSSLFSFLLMNSTWWLVILCSLFHLLLSYYTVCVTYYWFVYSYCLRSKYTDNYFSVKIDKCHVVITHLKKDSPWRPITSLTLATKLLSTSYVLWWVVLGDI